MNQYNIDTRKNKKKLKEIFDIEIKLHFHVWILNLVAQVSKNLVESTANPSDLSS